MKYLVHCTAPITSLINADDLRGEPRWERNALEALVSSGREVHTVWDVWKSPEPCPPNLHSGIKEEWLDDSIMITYGVTGSTNIGDIKAKYYIVQYLDGPNTETKNGFLKHHYKNPGSILATCSFKGWHWLRRLREELGSENVEWVEGPAVPFIVEGESFNKPYLFWSYRNFWDYMDREPGQMELLFNKIANFLAQDSSLKFKLLIHPWGPRHAEITEAMKGNRIDWVLRHSFAKSLIPFRNRIEVVSAINWKELLEIMSQTRLIVSPPEPLGGSPYEASMYGVPIILGDQTNPFQDSEGKLYFPEVLRAPSHTISFEFLKELEHLFSDHDYYKQHGDAYRKYTEEHATYKAWLDHLDEITQKRGWT